MGNPFPNSSLTDFESLTLDAAGNVESRTLRRKDPEPVSTIAYSYDALNRETVGMLGVTSTYDNLSRVTSRTYDGQTVSFQYDALGRQTDETTWAGTVHRSFDPAGRLTAITGPSGYAAGYDYLVTGELKAITDSASATLVTYAYDDLGRRTSLTRGNGVTTSYAYDASGALGQLTLDEAGTAYDQTVTYTRNAASQILTKASSNSVFDLTARPNATIGYTKNGLNQLTGSTVGSTTYALSYDGRGNLAGDTVNTYGYDLANRLTSSNGWTLSYDAMGRLAQISNGSTIRRFVYDGTNLVQEYVGSGSGTYTDAYVHGGGVDEPLVWYDVANGNTRRFLAANEQGSVVTITDNSGNLATLSGVSALNGYDEYGVPKSTNVGRFQYTGQTWLPEVGLYYYKARVYSPTLGRFLQTDPIGMKDDFNLYAYVGEDPVNKVDPTGTEWEAYDSAAPWLQRLLIGIDAHQSIQREVSPIPGYFVEQARTGSVLDGATFGGRVDIGYDPARIFGGGSYGNIWEIKPDNPRAIAEGKAQLALYSAISSGRFTPADTLPAGLKDGQKFQGALGTYTIHFRGDGVIGYTYVEKARKKKEARAPARARPQESPLERQLVPPPVGISTPCLDCHTTKGMLGGLW